MTTREERAQGLTGTVPIQWFFNLFLLVVVAVPLLVAAYVAIDRASDTAFAEVRQGNQRAAITIAGRIDEYIEGERKLLQAMGEASVQMRDAMAHEAVLDSFLVKNTHIIRAAVFDEAGHRVAGDKELDAGVALALADKAASIVPKQKKVGALSVGHVVFWTEPLWVAGVFSGAIVAEVELVGLWQPVASVTIGNTGFVRLVTVDGKLLAHGDAGKRGDVYSKTSGVTDPQLFRAGELGELYNDPTTGEPLIVTSAKVPAIGSVVIIEQSSAEALRGVAAMKTWLLAFFAGAVVVALILGLLLSRRVVQPLEALSDHVEVLAEGDLDARVDSDSITRLSEVRSLAVSINDMAGRLDALQREKLGQERLSTFARVAAGLAHDIRHPIESVRAACYEVLAHPDDEIVKEMFRDVTEVDLPRLKKFIDDLQGLAKTGSLSLERADHDAFSLALEAVDEIKVAPKWGKVVEFTATSDLDADVSVDPSLVKRALYNLMNNAGEACMGDGALKNGARGKVGVTVKLAGDGDMVAFDVTDTGPGIEASRLPDLLSSDFKSTKRSSGVGLGLGVVRQVAESHGGQLAIESTPGEGSTFTILLPRTPVDRPTMRTETES